MLAFINDDFLPAANAVVHVNDLAVQRGYGVFDFFKISEGHIFFIDDYLDRFYRSAEYLRLTVPLGRIQLTEVVRSMIQQNQLAESGIKIILTGGYSTDGYTPAKPNLIITQHPLVLPDAAVVDNGVGIITHEYLRDLPEAKSINYIMGIWLMKRLQQEKAADVLYHERGIVSEFPRCNFFIVKKDNTVVTPARSVLHGVTRKNILKIAAQEFGATEGTITLDDVYNASEAFLTSTTKRVLPVIRVDDRIIGSGRPGPVSLALLEGLKQLEREDKKVSS
jgi:branched-chain amino acid aminotransferase